MNESCKAMGRTLSQVYKDSNSKFTSNILPYLLISLPFPSSPNSYAFSAKHAGLKRLISEDSEQLNVSTEKAEFMFLFEQASSSRIRSWCTHKAHSAGQY